MHLYDVCSALLITGSDIPKAFSVGDIPLAYTLLPNPCFIAPSTSASQPSVSCKFSSSSITVCNSISPLFFLFFSPRLSVPPQPERSKSSNQLLYSSELHTQILNPYNFFFFLVKFHFPTSDFLFFFLNAEHYYISIHNVCATKK